MVERDIKLHVVNHPDDKGSFFSSSAEKLNYLILIGKIALETRVVVEASSIAFKQVFQQINIFLASEVSNPYFVFSRWKSWPHFQKGVSQYLQEKIGTSSTNTNDLGVLFEIDVSYAEVTYYLFFQSKMFDIFLDQLTHLDSPREVLTFASSSKNRTNNSFLLYAQGVFSCVMLSSPRLYWC